MTGSPDHRRKGFKELGPAWITAISGLIVAIIGAAAFFTGRATAPSAASTAPPAQNAGQTTSPAGQSTAAQPGAGTVLATYSVDVSDNYGISFGNTKPTPVPAQSNTGGDLVYNSYPSVGSSGQLAVLNATAASYAACKDDTRYTNYLDHDVQTGLVLCFTGHGVIAGIKVTNVTTDIPGGFVSLDVTVWQNGSPGT